MVNSGQQSSTSSVSERRRGKMSPQARQLLMVKELVQLFITISSGKSQRKRNCKIMFLDYLEFSKNFNNI